MIKPFDTCPQCKTGTMEVQFAVVMREICHNCDYLTQRRVTPLISGGQGMLEHLVNQALMNEENLPTLGTVLQQQLARVRRREAKRTNRDNGGSPPREEDWR